MRRVHVKSGVSKSTLERALLFDPDPVERL